MDAQSKGKSPTPIVNSWWVRGNSALLPPSSISSLIVYYYSLGAIFYETICMRKKSIIKPIPKEIANYMASSLTISILQDSKREREHRCTYQYCLSHECLRQFSISLLFFLCLLLFLMVLLLLIIAFL